MSLLVPFSEIVLDDALPREAEAPLQNVELTSLALILLGVPIFFLEIAHLWRRGRFDLLRAT